MSEKANFRALLPMIVFLVLFIGTGIALTAAGADMPFYQLSATSPPSCSPSFRARMI